MDRKFYVSLEAARLLKEKGYDRECDYHIEEVVYGNMTKEQAEKLETKFPCPTKTEAIDWLDSKGIVVMLYMYSIIYEDYTIKGCWGYRLLRGNELLFDDNSSNFPTRLEAKDAAIIKALELL